jgi:hypothetical protein
LKDDILVISLLAFGILLTWVILAHSSAGASIAHTIATGSSEANGGGSIISASAQAACSGLNQGDSCQLITPVGYDFNGTCQIGGNVLLCTAGN